MDHDDLQRRCPKLGHGVRFSYCRSCGEAGGICYKVLDCWWEHFDVTAFFERYLPPEEFQRLQEQRPRPKINTILHLIQQARERSKP